MTADRDRLPSGPEGIQTRLLYELESSSRTTSTGTLNRHMAIAKDWMPHDYIPWSRGRDFAFAVTPRWPSALHR